MNRILFILLIFLSGHDTTFAQQPNGRERIRSIKVAFITDRIQLTPAQSSRFWPVYDQYLSELRAIRKDFRQKNNADNRDDAQSRQFIEDNLDYQEQEVALKRKYKTQLLQIISARQLVQLYQAEREFKKLLMERLQNRRGRGDRND